MNALECIQSRKTIRSFQSQSLSNEDLQYLIKAAISAPSACNFQAWKFISITDPAIRDKLSHRSSPIIKKAPQGIVVLYRNDLSYNGYLYKDYVQSAAAAIENLLLAATEKGLATCWICDLNRPKQIIRLLHIPKNFDIIAYIALGYPQPDQSALSLKHYGTLENLQKRKRKYDIHQVLCSNVFSITENDCTFVPPLPGVYWKSHLLKRKFSLNRFFENRF